MGSEGFAGMALPAQSTRSWVVHLQGRTLVEGIAEGFRHPNPMCPDPIAKLSQIRDVSWEKLCSVFMDRTYPEESGFSPDERDRMRVAFRRRFFDGRRDAHSQFGVVVLGCCLGCCFGLLFWVEVWVVVLGLLLFGLLCWLWVVVWVVVLGCCLGCCFGCCFGCWFDKAVGLARLVEPIHPHLDDIVCEKACRHGDNRKTAELTAVRRHDRAAAPASSPVPTALCRPARGVIR